MKPISWTRFGVFALLVTGALVLAATARAATSDAWITSKVKMELLTSPDLGLPIHVDTNDGLVTLAGKVDSEQQREHAERIASRVNGVRDVRNLIEVVPRNEARQVNTRDRQLQRRIEDALDHDPDLDRSDIHVKSVDRGTVLLSGRGTTAETARALEMARRMPGVTRAVSEIQVADRDEDHYSDRTERDRARYDRASNDERYPDRGDRYSDNDRSDRDRDYVARGEDADRWPDRGERVSDSWITTKVKLKYMTDRSVPAHDVSVDTWNGRVTLFGSVPSREVKMMAAREAEQVRGVRGVDNQLVVVPHEEQRPVHRHDADLQSAVREKIDDANMSGAHVRVRVVDGVAQLTGRVRNSHDRLHAVALARSTRGVRSVRDDLHEMDESRAAR